MATPTADTYTAPTGTTLVRCGVPVPPATPVFDSVAQLSTGANSPLGTAAQTVIVSLHGSGNNLTGLVGTTVREAALNPASAYSTKTTFLWHEQKAGTITVNGVARTAMRLMPADRQPDNGTNRRESDWCGWTIPEDGRLHLYTERHVDAMIALLEADPRCSAARWVLDGGSMGGWGTMSYGIRRAHKFPAIYPDRGRMRSAVTAGQVSIHDWVNPTTPVYPFASAPLLAVADGGYSAAVHMDHIAWVSNTANRVPWIGMATGSADPYYPFQDYIDMVAALRAAHRGFAFVWNAGTHGNGPLVATPTAITGSYPYGLFERDKGYPIFSNHSGDQVPGVDAVGGINQHLSFRNVTESAGAWSCEITSTAGARTVDVLPYSLVYTGTPSAAHITIPAANAWVTVSF